MKGEAVPKSYNDIAFKVNHEDLDMYVKRILKLGLDVKKGRPRVEGEALSIHFYDYDNHLFELHTGTLTNRLDEYSKE